MDLDPSAGSAPPASPKTCAPPKPSRPDVLRRMAAEAPADIRLQMEDNLRWIEQAEENRLVVGAQARILYADSVGRIAIARAFNEAISRGDIGPVVLGRDHHDVSGTDSPYRETSNIYDGSRFTADMAVHNAIGDSFRGATWVSLHNGGGVGWGEVINGGFGMLLDGSPEADRRLSSMLFYDVNNGIARRAWARNEEARTAIRREMDRSPGLKGHLGRNCRRFSGGGCHQPRLLSIFGGMKTVKTLLLAGAALLMAASCTQNGGGSSSGEGLNIGYVRLDSLTQLYTYHTELVAEFEATAKKMEAELIRSQQNLQAEYEVLQKAAPNLSKIELERAQLDFQRVNQNYQALEQQRSGELAQEEAKMNAIVKEQVDKAIAKLQEDMGLDLIFVYESNLLYGSEALDLTGKLAEILNSMEAPSREEAETAK